MTITAIPASGLINCTVDNSLYCRIDDKTACTQYQKGLNQGRKTFHFTVTNGCFSSAGCTDMCTAITVIADGKRGLKNCLLPGGDADTVGDKSDNYLQNDQAGNNTQGQFSGSASCRDTASTFFIIEFSVIIKNSTNLQPCGVLPPLLFSPICFKKSKDAVLLHL